jgi:hypothetical protein
MGNAARRVCLALMVLGTGTARAGDGLAPVKLALKGKVREAAVAPDGTLYFLEGSVVRNSAQKDEPGQHRVFAWDLDKNKEGAELKGIPAGACSMAVIGDKLVVACGQEGLAIVDLGSKAVKMWKDEKVFPRWVSPDSPRGQALIVGATKLRGDIVALIGLDSERGRPISSVSWTGGHLAATPDVLAQNGPFAAGGPGAESGWVSFINMGPGTAPKMFQGGATSALPYQPIPSPAAMKGTPWGWKLNFGPFRAVNGGTSFVATEHPKLAATDEGTAVLCLDSDCSKVLWTEEGHSLLGVSTTRPLAVLRKNEGDAKHPEASVAKWTIDGVNVLTGKQVWEATLAFASPVEQTWPYDPSPMARTIVSREGGDRLVFALRDAKAGASDEPSWFEAALPKSGLAPSPLLEGPVADSVHVGVPFAFTPKLEHASGATFSLKAAPEGMTIDAKTAAISWTPGPKAIATLPGGIVEGRHWVVVAAQVGGEERIVTSFELEVTPVPVAHYDPATTKELHVSAAKGAVNVPVPGAVVLLGAFAPFLKLHLPGDVYFPGGVTPLVLTATLADGRLYNDLAQGEGPGGPAEKIPDPHAIWRDVKVTATSGKVSLLGGDKEYGTVVFSDPDPVASLEQSVTITITSKSRPELTASVTLAPDYALGATLNFDGEQGDEGPRGTLPADGKKGGPGKKGKDAKPVEVSLSYVATKAHGQLVVARASSEDGKAACVFDPSKLKLKLWARGGKGGMGGDGHPGKDAPQGAKPQSHLAQKGGAGGKGGRGGKGAPVTVVYDSAHPELAKLVVVDNGGGDGGDLGSFGQGGNYNYREQGAAEQTGGEAGDQGEPGEVGEAGPDPVFRADK